MDGTRRRVRWWVWGLLGVILAAALVLPAMGSPTGSGDSLLVAPERPTVLPGGNPVAPPEAGMGDAAANGGGAKAADGLNATAGDESGATPGFAASPEIAAAPDAGALQPGARAKIAPPAPEPRPTPPVDEPDRSVVRTARLALAVTDVPRVSAAVRDTAGAVGGLVASERSLDRAASFTLRVPSDRLDEVMGRLAALGTVTERFGQAEDVTDQVVDLQGRLATQRASVARVRALLERANTVGEVVSIESELASREAELESVQRRLASVQGRVSLSTLTVDLAPVTPPAPPPSGNGFLAGLAGGWQAFVTVLGGLSTVLGAVLPFLGALALVVAAVLLGRRAVRRHRAGNAALRRESAVPPRDTPGAGAEARVPAGASEGRG